MVRTEPEDDYDRKLLHDVQEHGWHLIGIDDEDSSPAYVFSIGMFHTLGHPEICMFGLSQTATMGQIINGIGDLVRDGQHFKDGDESGDVLDGFQCAFRSVDPQVYQEFFGYARWFYEGDDFPMLQCVWPDREHRYPWDAEYEAQSQPVMATHRAWPFCESKSLGVYATKYVVEDGHEVLRVSHDVDGDWQFLCGKTTDSADARLVCLEEIVERHPSVLPLADLPIGWHAEREAADQPWVRGKNDPD